MNHILRFKYSFTALMATIIAIVANLLCVFSIQIIAGLLCLALTALVVSYYLLENRNFVVTFAVFFIAGIVSSTIYNTNFRVYPVPNYLNEEKAWLSGTISEIKVKNKYARVYLKSPEIYSELADSLYIPNIIVSRFTSRLKNAKIGDEFTAKVILQKPKGKFFIDDFAYDEYLLQNRINLLAQVRGDLYITPPEDSYSLLEKMANYRMAVANKIGSNSHPAALAQALITGVRGNISKDIQEDFRNSGLAHLMAISGMHMAFLAGIIFLLVRYTVCSIPLIALNYDSRKIAGFLTLFAALFYLLLAGASLPTMRAFIMIALFIVTMMLNRSKLALHTLCVVAIILLLSDPMAIFSVSFQLSFSAVFAMLLYNELKQKELILSHGRIAKMWRGFVNSLNISIIAFTATMFVVSVHFNYLSVLAIMANVIASILMALLIMPVLFVYFIGYIMLDTPLFEVLNNYCLTLLLNLADYFANFNNSSVYISGEYAIFLLFVALMILSVVIFDYGRKYLISLSLFILAFTIPINLDLRPDIFELNNGSLALRKENDLMVLGQIDKRNLKKIQDFYKLEVNDFVLEKQCDISGCVYDFKGKKILHMNEGFSISNEDLNSVDYMVTEN